MFRSSHYAITFLGAHTKAHCIQSNLEPESPSPDR
jgi:hypothetical protein